MFTLRQHYNTVFGDYVDENQLSEIGSFKEMKKVYKVKYTLNILPSMSERVTTLMDALGDTEELDVFECKAVMDMIDFKWLQYSRQVHYMGLIAHMMYLGFFSIYIFEIFIYKTGKFIEVIESIMIIGILYPMIYDMTQLKK